MEALKLEPTRTMQELGMRLKELHDDYGVTYTLLEKETGVNRGSINTLAVNGTSPLKQPAMDKLWTWIDDFAYKMGEKTEPATQDAAAYKTAPELILTADLQEGMGYCVKCIEQRELGILIGKPGTGKTTLANLIAEKYPHVIRIEAWLTMRMNDVLDEIATGLGLTLRGRIQVKIRRLVEELKKRPETIIIVDEAEYLRKTTSEKIDTLRKLQDNCGFTLLFFGTGNLQDAVNHNDTQQLSSRMAKCLLTGDVKHEVREALKAYDMEEAVQEKLVSIAANVNNGGMRKFGKVLRLCLISADGGRVTEDNLREASMYIL